MLLCYLLAFEYICFIFYFITFLLALVSIDILNFEPGLAKQLLFSLNIFKEKIGILLCISLQPLAHFCRSNRINFRLHKRSPNASTQINVCTLQFLIFEPLLILVALFDEVVISKDLYDFLLEYFKWNKSLIMLIDRCA